MRRIIDLFRYFGRFGDLILLFLCLLANTFGCIIVASTTSYQGSTRYVIIQIAAAVIGILIYIILTAIDVEVFAERRGLLVLFNVFLMILLIPFGITAGGNRSWIHLPFFPVNIQPAEICKITFVILIAKVLAIHQNKLSTLRTLGHLAFHAALMIGMIVVLSQDDGVALIFIFTIIVMVYVGGFSMKWILCGALMSAVFAPFFWKYGMAEYQQLRIQMLFDSSIDPLGIGIRYHTKQSLLSLTGGGLTGQGLFHGNRTQVGDLNAQHTDFIFSAIGEELGFLGCLLTLILLTAIIVRCIYVGLKSPDYCNRLICIGVAATMVFQVCCNVGMCIGVFPVIGLTLPFISYGGSSIVSMYMAMGIVSGIHARPSHPKHERYIQGPL